MDAGAELTVVTLRGSWTTDAASKARRLDIRLAAIDVECGSGESQLPAVLVGGGFGALVGAAFNQPGRHEGKMLGGLAGLLLMALATSQ